MSQAQEFLKRARTRLSTVPATIVPIESRTKNQQQQRSPFVDQLPQFDVEAAYFNAIAVPGGITINAGESAWYGLRRIGPADIAQEFSLTGAAIELLPTDSLGTATGYGSLSGWGDKTGISSYLVVGVNLPIQQGQWSSAKAYLAGIEGGGGHADQLLNPSKPPRYIIRQSFPTGLYTDPAPNKPPLRFSFSPHVYRITEGNTLDVALVVRGAQIAAASGKTIVGFGSVSLTIGLSDSKSDFRGM